MPLKEWAFILEYDILATPQTWISVMSAFSPSPQFAKRWLATPNVVKQAFHQELEDIIDMLYGTTDAQQFAFTHPNFGDSIAHLLATHKPDKPSSKLIHTLDSRLSLTNDTPAFDDKELPTVERHIYDKLSTQIDDFLAEHTAELAEDLKAWLQTAIKHELATYHK